jgi:ABC-type spermidine/putrescine transport system permease subunit I
VVAAFDRSSAETSTSADLTRRLKGWLLRNESLRGYFLLSPTLLVIFVLMVAPLCAMVGLSFATQDYVTIDYGFSLKNYGIIFEPSSKPAYFLGIPFYLQKPIYLLLLFKSILISLAATIAVVLLAYPMAYFLAFRVTKHKITWLILITVPFFTSYLLRVFAWKVILGYNGVINSSLMSLGLLEKPLAFLLYSQTSVIITLARLGRHAILPSTSRSRKDRPLAGSTRPGDTRLQRFFRITLPLSMPGTIAASLLVFIPTVGDYITPTLVGGTNGIMIGNIVQSLFGKGGNWPMGAAVSIVAMAVITVLVCLFLWGVGRRPTSRAEGVIHRGAPARFDLIALYAVGYLIFLYGPVLLLPLFSFNDSIYVAFPLKGFTLQWYAQMAENGPLQAALASSLKVGLAVSVISTILGIFAAKAVTRYHLPYRAPVMGLIMLPLVIPSIILGIALLTLVIKVLGIEPSLYTIGAAHVLICVPFAMLVMISRLEGFDKSLEEASLDLGEGAWATFRRVTLPLAMPGIVASMLLCFTTSFDEFLLAFFLSGNEATLPIYIWGQLRLPTQLPNVLALGSCILAASFVFVFLSERLRRRGLATP